MAAKDEPEMTGPQECAPCRATGQVISKLGGEPATMTCPWCEGSGTVIAEHAAQAVRRAAAASSA
ncbi:MAG: hypothetical protein ACR2LK_01045 [Solirubrobacteraceae bacterium]